MTPENDRRGTRLIWASVLLLAALAGACFYVSYRAQYTFVYFIKRQGAPSLTEALIPDVGMVICAALGLGMAVTGRPAKVARVLVLAFAALSGWMNYLAAYSATVHAVTVYVMPPVAFAVCTDLVISTVRRYYYGITDESPWAAVGRSVLRVLALAAAIALYSLRFALDCRETYRGLRQMVLDAAPLPEAPEPGDEPARSTKKALLLAAYRAHPEYGKRAVASQVAKELAPGAGLKWGTARTYVGDELARMNGRAS